MTNINTLYELKTDLSTLIALYYTKIQSDTNYQIKNSFLDGVTSNLQTQINNIILIFDSYSTTLINNSLYQPKINGVNFGDYLYWNSSAWVVGSS